MNNINENISILEREFNHEFENSHLNKYLVLDLCGRQYALELRYVAAIIEPGKAIFVKKTSAGTELFIKHKDKLIQTLSLRKIFNLSENKIKDNISIIININETQKALIVDSIMDIEDIDGDNCEKKRTAIPAAGGDYIKTTYRIDGVVKNILNIEKIFSN